MYPEIPEVDPEDPFQGDLHIGLERTPESDRDLHQLVFDPDVTVHPDHRGEELPPEVYIPEKDLVMVREVETGVGAKTVDQVPVPHLVHAQRMVLLPVKAQHGTIVAIPCLRLVGERLFQLYPESHSGGVTSPQPYLLHPVLREGGGGETEEYDDVKISHGIVY